MELKEKPSNLTIFSYNFFKLVKTPAPYLMIFGVILWLRAFYLFCEGWKLPLFNKLPGPYEVITEWLNPDTDWGISMYSPEYHDHIYYSCRRILIAFAIVEGVFLTYGFLPWGTPRARGGPEGEEPPTWPGLTCVFS